MAQNKIHITPDNMPEWLASTGYLFPRNELELARFDKLYPLEEDNLNDFEVDCAGILSEKSRKKTIALKPETKEEDITPLKMVARKGAHLPQHILDKIKKNQDERTKDNPRNQEKGTE